MMAKDYVMMAKATINQLLSQPYNLVKDMSLSTALNKLKNKTLSSYTQYTPAHLNIFHHEH